MGKHNFIIVMTRSATVALGAYTVRLGSRIDKRSVEFSTLHVRPPVAHTQNLDCENTLEPRDQAKRIYIPSFSNPPPPLPPSQRAVQRGVTVAQLTRLQNASSLYAHSSNAWPLSCWCNQNEIRERERERERQVARVSRLIICL